MYMIFDVNKLRGMDTTNMRKSLDGKKVIYYENLTGEENIQQYTHEEILEILETPEWTEGVEAEEVEEIAVPTIEERLQMAEDTIMFMLMGGM